VSATTTGTSRLRRDHFEKRPDETRKALLDSLKSPERGAKIAAAKKGKPRPRHVIEAMRQANLGRKASGETRQRMSEAAKRRGAWPLAAGRPWTAEEETLLGSILDREVTAWIGPYPSTVANRRIELGIPSYRRHAPTSPRRDWTSAENSLLGSMPDPELAAQLGCTPIMVFCRRRKLGIPAYRG
jgi:hypothetical protein